MAYIALYRKYRPQTFTDVVGQHQVSDTLMRAIREDKVAHAYLFAGPRGTGKTSMAKILRALSTASMVQRITLVTSVVLVNRFEWTVHGCP